jgi:hypothetical protein
VRNQLPSHDGAVLDLLREIVVEQREQREVLSSILRLLEHGRGPRDRADIALLAAVAEAIGDRQFTSAQLMAHATVHPALHEALEAADITNAHEFGCVFRRMEGIAVTGFRLERAGVVWQVRVCEI